MKLGACAVVALSFGAGAVAAQGEAGWTKVFDSSTVLPGAFPKAHFLSAPGVSGKNVAFAARTTDDFGDYDSIYAVVDGTVHRVADPTTIMPQSNGATMLYTLYIPSIEGSEVATYAVGFRYGAGDEEYAWNAGTYRWTPGGGLSVVADELTTVYGGTTPFYEFSAPDIRGGKVIFNGVDPEGDAAGVYVQSPGGQVTVIADMSTPVPGHPGLVFEGFPFRLPHTTFMPDGSAVFAGWYAPVPNGPVPGGTGDGYGIFWKQHSGQTVVIAEDDITPIPHGGGIFWDIYTPVVSKDDGTVLFVGRDGDTRGIYAWKDGVLRTVVDNSTPLPDGSKTFGSFGPNFEDSVFAYDDGVLLFEGYDRITDLNNVLHGLYLATPGGIKKIMAQGDVFDGKVIDYWRMSRDSLSPSGIALSVHFTDDSAGIYMSGDVVATPGDTNWDGVVDAADLANLINGHQNGLSGRANGDFNRDGRVSADDFAVFSQAMAMGVGGPAGVVPEGGSVVGAALVSAGLWRRRRVGRADCWKQARGERDL